MIWNKYELSLGEQMQVQLGTVLLAIRKEKNAYTFYQSETEEGLLSATNNAFEIPESEGCMISCDPNESLQLLPALPDKPLILKSLPKLKIMPKSALKLFLFIPISVQFYTGKISPETLIFEKGSKQLSQAWLGETDSGTLAYSLFDSISTNLNTDISRDWKAVCPVTFENQSKTAVEPSRLSVDVTRLILYQQNGQLCTNEVILEYNGADSPIDVKFGQEKSAAFPEAELLANQRNPEEKNLLVKSYNFLKSISQYR